MTRKGPDVAKSCFHLGFAVFCRNKQFFNVKHGDDTVKGLIFDEPIQGRACTSRGNHCSRGTRFAVSVFQTLELFLLDTKHDHANDSLINWISDSDCSKSVGLQAKSLNISDGLQTFSR